MILAPGNIRSSSFLRVEYLSFLFFRALRTRVFRVPFTIWRGGVMPPSPIN